MFMMPTKHNRQTAKVHQLYEGKRQPEVKRHESSKTGSAVPCYSQVAALKPAPRARGEWVLRGARCAMLDLLAFALRRERGNKAGKVKQLRTTATKADDPGQVPFIEIQLRLAALTKEQFGL